MSLRWRVARCAYWCAGAMLVLAAGGGNILVRSAWALVFTVGGVLAFSSARPFAVHVLRAVTVVLATLAGAENGAAAKGQYLAAAAITGAALWVLQVQAERGQRAA